MNTAVSVDFNCTSIRLPICYLAMYNDLSILRNLSFALSRLLGQITREQGTRKVSCGVLFLFLFLVDELSLGPK